MTSPTMRVTCFLVTCSQEVRRRTRGSLQRGSGGLWPPLLVQLVYWSCLVVGIAAKCPQQWCVCNDETLVVTCNNTNLSVVPITLNPAIHQLFLTHNNITAVIAGFSFYNDLEYLDLSHNEVSVIETHGFEVQEKLRVLKLGYNNISEIVNETFYGLHALTALELNDNRLQTLPSRVFVYVHALEELDLSSNHISAIAADAFAGLDALRTLHLRNNLLKDVPSTSFEPIPSLATLDIGQNPFGGIAARAFRALPYLQQLYVDSCGLRDLQSGVFEGIIGLRALHIQSNGLRAIPETLSTLDRLEHLEVGQNPLEEVTAHAFPGLRSLRVLEVGGASMLEAVRKGAFLDNAQLHTISLVYNPRLSVIEVGAFDGLAGLRVLSLRGNALATFSETLLVWDDLETLDLRDNPIQCNCSLLWLRNLLHARNLSSAMSDGGQSLPPVATCYVPERVRGRSLAELSADDLACYFPDVRQQALVGIVAAVVVACVATLVLVVLKYRKRVTTVLKDKWSDGALRRKEHQYEKTNDEEENNILHAAAQQSLKMTPVTEL